MALEGVFRDWRRQQSLFPFLRRQFFDVAAVHGFLEAHLPDGADFPARKRPFSWKAGLP